MSPPEPSLELTVEDLKRETFLEIQEDVLYYLYKLHLQSFWLVEEINFEKDKEDFKTLPPEEQIFMKKICTFFLISDAVVGDAVENFAFAVPAREAKAFYSVQNMIENTHIETYSKMFDIVNGNTDLDECLKAINQMTSILKKRSFCVKKRTNIAEQIAAFVFIEGVFFAASFSGIFWFKNRGKCKGIVQANAWILRDENLHCRFGCEILKRYFKEEISAQEIYEIAVEVFEIECDFIRDLLPNDLGTMTKKDLTEYVKFCINSILALLSLNPLFERVTQPFPNMDYINFSDKTNFFENRVNNYNRKTKSAHFSYSSSFEPESGKKI